MRKQVFLLFALLLVGILAMQANPRDAQKAKAIAAAKAASLGTKLGRSVPTKTDGKVTAGGSEPYYIFNFADNTGYAVVSGEDEMPAIVGYSRKGSLDEDSLPVQLKDFLKAYQATVEAVRKNDTSAVKNVKAAMARVAGSVTPVKPLLGGIVWNQGTPFNNQCPIYDGENRAVTGCVATAMAQIMMYWKYPEQLKADIDTYEINYINWYTQETWTNTYGGIGKGIAYDWDNMLEDYNGGYTDAQADAVATLMSHCGLSVKMQYAGSSGAYMSDVPSAFINQFGYDKELVQFLQRNMFEWDEWNGILQRELYAQRPIYYGGFASIGGHAFVCDGIDADGYYHINWGWGGMSDDYFDITILNPYDRGAGASSSSDGFNSGNEIVIGLKPDNGVKDDPLVTFDKLVICSSNIDFTKFKRENAFDNFKGNVSMSLQNLTDTTYKALLAVAIKNEDGSFTPVAPAREVEIEREGEYGSCYVRIDFDYNFPVGQYYLYGIESTDGGTTWQTCYGNTAYGIHLNVTEQYIQISDTDMSKGVVVDGIRYEMFPETSSATVIANDYVEDVVIPEKVMYENMTYTVTALGDGCFDGCAYLTSVVVPSSVKALGNSCFGNAYNLLSVTLPEGITTIPINCFVSNYKLQGIRIPESVTRLEEGAFGICCALTQLTIPSKVNYIGINCFWASDAIKQLVCLAEVPPTCLSIPENCETLYVPKASLDAYKTASPWSSIANILPINIEISQTSAILKTNETLQLTATVHSSEVESENVDWLTSNAEVAAVSDNGLVTAIGDGIATITAGVTVDGLYQTASCIVTVTSEDGVEVQNVDNLKAGSLIRIYPYGQDGVSGMALSSNAHNAVLTTTENAGKEGNIWKLEDAGDGYYYIINDLGQYWAFQQSNDPSSTMYTKSSQSEAVKVRLEWNAAYSGIAFKNANDGTYLNNLYGYNNSFNWYDGELPLTYDTNCTYHVYTCFSKPDGNLFDALSFDQHELTFELDGTKWGFQLSYSPSNADISKVSLSNSDESVASVSMSKAIGNKNYIFINIELLNIGTTTITAKTTDGSNLSDQCVINVIEPTGIDGITIGDNNNVSYYNIDGVRIASCPRQPGVYIREVNGIRQKIVVR